MKFYSAALLGLLLSFNVTAGSSEAPKNENKLKVTPHDSAQMVESGKTSHRFLIRGQSFFGITVGDKLSQHADKLKQETVQMRDGGVYEAFYIYEGPMSLSIGSVEPGGRQWDSVHSMTITDFRAVTEQGIKVGTTWETLKSIIPSLELRRLGVEGEIFALSGNTGYQLNIDPGTYTDESSIKKDHRVTAIWLGTAQPI